jgi:hypothetical protein
MLTHAHNRTRQAIDAERSPLEILSIAIHVSSEARTRRRLVSECFCFVTHFGICVRIGIL